MKKIIIAALAFMLYACAPAPTPHPTPEWLDPKNISRSQTQNACAEDAAAGVPYEFSRCNPDAVSPVEPDDNFDAMQDTTQCLIKGNISIDTGQKIYHMPGQSFYDKTVIDTAYGERWFCTEEEAIAAGWRKAAN